MKTIIIAVTLVLTSTVYAFASHREIDPKVITIFKEKFPLAKDDTWIEQTEFYKVSFTYEGKTLFAFYNKTCKLICVIRYMPSTELPSDPPKHLKRTNSTYWLTYLLN